MQEEASETTSIGIVLFKIPRENKNVLSRLSNPSERGEGAAPYMCSSASDTGKINSFAPEDLNLTSHISWGLTAVGYTTLQLRTYIATRYWRSTAKE